MDSSSQTTTFVLVHGAWHAARCWERVTPLLRDAGHRVVAPDLTGHGSKTALLSPAVDLTTHVQDVVDAIGDRRDVVLVGHSYAGMVISGVAQRVPERITRLVFLDAMVPVDGENAIDVAPVTQLMIDAVAGASEPWRIPPIPELPAPLGLAGITDPSDIAWLRTMLGDESSACFTERIRLDNPEADAVPREHVHCVGFKPEGFDRRPVPAVQPNGTPAIVRDIRSGHDCMVSHPAELANLLLASETGA